jgi:hypothetical protein
MKSFRYIAPVVVTAISVLVSSEAIAKTYYRSCSARYEVKVVEVDGMSQDVSKEVTPGFSGRGKCGPYTRINDCRRRARDFCQTCMKEHWGHPSSRPSACTYYSGGVGVQNYNIHNLTNTLDHTACSARHWRPGASIRYTVYRVTRGDKGCGGGTTKTMKEVLGSRTTECR